MVGIPGLSEEEAMAIGLTEEEAMAMADDDLTEEDMAEIINIAGTTMEEAKAMVDNLSDEDVANVIASIQ
jgi:ribosomal protein L12E/L44/L45/RPP1/RPP2